MKKIILSLAIAMSMLFTAIAMPCEVLAESEFVSDKFELLQAEGKKVSIDFNVVVNADEWGIYNGNDHNVLEDIKYGIYTAENLVISENDVIEANTLFGNGDVRNMPNNENSNVKKVFFNNIDSIPVGKYYIKQKQNSDIFECSEDRYYFSVSDSQNNTNTYIDLTECTPTVNLKCKNMYFSVSAVNSGVENASLAITNNRGENKIIYNGLSDNEGLYSNLPQLPKGRYSFTVTAPKNYLFDDTNTFNGEFVIDEYSFSTTAPVTISLIAEKTEDVETADKSDREIELENKIQDLEDELLIYKNRLIGDVDRDGKVTARDSLLILRYTLHLYEIES